MTQATGQYYNADFIAASGQGITYEPQRTHMWKLTLLTAPGGISKSAFEISMLTCPIPAGENGIETINYGNEVRYVPGRYKVTAFDISLTEYVGLNTLAQLWKWRSLVYPGLGTTGAIGLASAVKATGLLTLDAPDLSIKRQFLLQGLWPTKDPVPNSVLTYADSTETMKVQMHFSIDKVLPHTGIAG